MDVALAALTARALLAARGERIATAVCGRGRSLCAEHAVSLKAAALAFAFLPACVSKVAIGLAEASLVAETVALLAEAKAVPLALWRDAVAKGLLAEGLVEGL